MLERSLVGLCLLVHVGFGDWKTLNQEVRGGRYTRTPSPV